MALPQVTMEGRLGADPELRFTPTGKAVAKMRVVTNDRRREGDQWVDGDALWMTVVVWGKPAENVAESLNKGDLITVSGRLRPNNWETSDGQKRYDTELVADEIGCSLRFRSYPHGGEGGGSGGRVERSSGQQARQQSDPWSGPAPSSGGDGWSEAPPF